MPKNEVTEQIKFTEEELTNLRQLQTDYQEKQNTLGQLSVQEIILNQQMEQLHSQRDAIQTEYIELQQKERNLVDELNAKYGIGSLDPETGIFTPSN